jgi:hypothetical protein
MLPAEGTLQAQFLHHTEIVPIQLGEVVQAQNRPHCAIAQEEFLGATHLCRDIRKSNSRRANWQRLVEPYDFFKGFKNYLQVWRSKEMRPSRAYFTCPDDWSPMLIPPAGGSV